MTDHRDLSSFVCERNARTARRAEAAGNVIFALLLGLAGALAIMHWCGWLL